MKVRELINLLEEEMPDNAEVYLCPWQDSVPDKLVNVQSVIPDNDWFGPDVRVFLSVG